MAQQGSGIIVIGALGAAALAALLLAERRKAPAGPDGTSAAHSDEFGQGVQLDLLLSDGGGAMGARADGGGWWSDGDAGLTGSDDDGSFILSGAREPSGSGVEDDGAGATVAGGGEFGSYEDPYSNAIIPGAERFFSDNFATLALGGVAAASVVRAAMARRARTAAASEGVDLGRARAAPDAERPRVAASRSASDVDAPRAPAGVSRRAPVSPRVGGALRAGGGILGALGLASGAGHFIQARQEGLSVAESLERVVGPSSPEFEAAYASHGPLAAANVMAREDLRAVAADPVGVARDFAQGVQVAAQQAIATTAKAPGIVGAPARFVQNVVGVVSSPPPTPLRVAVSKVQYSAPAGPPAPPESASSSLAEQRRIALRYT